ncbi:hypothetical protein GCM10011496_07810 [Polaromonas eurypsychrophila]|uniref:Uncharacterized protein n=1 Tax=Polaromonas eurypsychrophila TaxID=1614635 RepID=A0A916S9A5_9BURK|nr:hypothetical protein GCM10011496_07810 [Polaromonas eurypsychrophila]
MLLKAIKASVRSAGKPSGTLTAWRSSVRAMKAGSLPMTLASLGAAHASAKAVATASNQAKVEFRVVFMIILRAHPTRTTRQADAGVA